MGRDDAVIEELVYNWLMQAPPTALIAGLFYYYIQSQKPTHDSQARHEESLVGLIADSIDKTDELRQAINDHDRNVLKANTALISSLSEIKLAIVGAIREWKNGDAKKNE